MADVPVRIDYTARDFDAITAALEDHLRVYFGDAWQDFATSGLGPALYQLVAYVGEQLHFYLDRQANEVYLDTAVRRQSILRIARMLGYEPRSATAAVVPLRAQLSSAQALDTVIPLFSTVRDEDGTEYEFLTPATVPAGVADTFDQTVENETLRVADGRRSYTLAMQRSLITVGSLNLQVTIDGGLYAAVDEPDGRIRLPFAGSGLIDYDTGVIVLEFSPESVPDDGSEIVASYRFTQRITVHEGRTRLSVFDADGSPHQRHTLPDTRVLLDPLVRDDPPAPNPSRFEVWEGDPAPPFGQGQGTLWRRIDALALAGPTERVYEVRVTDDDEVQIRFGDGDNGVIPTPGATLHVVYRVGGGLRGNIASSFIDTSVVGQAGLTSVSVRVDNYQPGSGGAERESADEIRRNVPQALRTTGIAVTESDYDSLAVAHALPGGGSVARAKARLVPERTFTAQVQHAGVVLGATGSPASSEMFLRLPGAPVITETVRVRYVIGGVDRVAEASVVAEGVAEVSGVGLDGSSRIRTDQLDYQGVIPSGFNGDGTSIVFDTTVPVAAPVMPRSVVLLYTIDGTDLVAFDDGDGRIVGQHIHGPGADGHGTIDYVAGDIQLRFGTRPTILSEEAGPYDLAGIDSGGDVGLDIALDGAGAVAVVLTSGDFSDFAAATAAEVAAVINGVFSGLATVDEGRVRLTSDVHGTGGSVHVAAGTANAALQFPTDLVTGESFPPDDATMIRVDFESGLYLNFSTLPDANTPVSIDMNTGPVTELIPSNRVELFTWGRDAAGRPSAPGAALMDSLKAFLDMRRVIGTSVMVRAGFNIRLNVHLIVTYDQQATVADANQGLVDALVRLFDDRHRRADQDLGLAALYRAIHPTVGIRHVVIDDVGLRVPVATGDGTTALFRDEPTEPGRFIAPSRLPMVAKAGSVSVWRGDVRAGASSDDSTEASIASPDGILLSGSTVHTETGQFTLRFAAPLQRGVVVAVDYLLDDAKAEAGKAVWNLAVDPWEVVVLGQVFINDERVR